MVILIKRCIFKYCNVLFIDEIDIVLVGVK